MATYFVETADLACLNRTLFLQRYVTSRRWIWRILPYADVLENLLRPSSGNILAPRPVCPSCIGSFAFVFIRLSVCLYRGFASWSWNLGKLLLDCMASHPRGLCSTGYQTGEAPASSKWRLTHDWRMTLVGLERASMWRGALHIILCITFAHVVALRENIVNPVFFRSALCIF
jgi:hypothetical protein